MSTVFFRACLAVVGCGTLLCITEYINVHVGRDGVQNDNACWEPNCLEHGIQPDGQMPSEKTIVDGYDSFPASFDQIEEGRDTPRVPSADLDNNSSGNKTEDSVK